MWNPLKRRGSAAQDERQSQPKADAAPSPKRVTCGKGQLLYKYLSERYAQRVVLKFSEIEDLLGFSLPEQARRQSEWWTAAATEVDPLNFADSWTLANRTASPNLLAQIVVFERAI
jgi:hypothetical protein